MRKLLISLVICGALSVAAPALAADGTISGTVTHAVDSTPVVGMYISAQNVGTGVTSYVYGTDPAGLYSFTVEPGTYDITTYLTTATEPNVMFLQKTITVTVASGETKSNQDIAITRHGKFSGHIYSSDGVTPVQDANVAAYGTSGSGSGSSASNGAYFMTPVQSSDYSLSAVGTYTIYATKPGYYGTMLTNVALTADEATTTQDVRLTPGSTVSGTISDANGAALAGATVTLTKTTSGSSYLATTNASGAYTVSVYDLTGYGNSAIADYGITISKTGYVPHTASLSIETESSTLTGNNYTIATAGSITGTVKNSAGSGLSGVTVLANDGFGNSYSATTDASGNYTLSSLRSSSRYTLTATKTNYVGQKSYNISVTAGSTTSGKNFQLAAGKTYGGTVLAKSDNTALEGAVVYLYKRNKTRSEIADFSFMTKSDGTFTFRNVSPGKYRVKVVKTGYVTSVLDSATITADITGKAFKLELAGTIEGLVYTGKDTAVASSDIAVFAINNGKEVAYTAVSADEDGNYVIPGLKKGTYRLKITSTDFVTRVVKVTVKAGTKTTTNLKLTAAGSVSGFLTDKVTGLPVSAYVRVVGTSIATWSDPNGYYVLDGVAAGKRKITVVSPYYNLPAQKSVTVSAGKDKTGVNFTLTPR